MTFAYEKKKIDRMRMPESICQGDEFLSAVMHCVFVCKMAHGSNIFSIFFLFLLLLMVMLTLSHNDSFN